MSNRSNLLLDVLMVIPIEHVAELAVKALYYKDVNKESVCFTGNFDDQECEDGEKRKFDFMHYYTAGQFKERVLSKFNNLNLNESEEAFVNAIGNDLKIIFEDWDREIKSLKCQLHSQAKSYESKLEEWRTNHKQLTTAYNDLHYQYKQLKAEKKDE